MNVTQSALDEMKKAIIAENSPMAGIRLFTQKSCCGLSLGMSVDKNLSLGDKLITIDDVRFFISPTAEEMIKEVTIDFTDIGFKLEGLKKEPC